MLKPLIRAVAGLALTAGLAGCIDAHVEIDVLSETTAHGTVTEVMAPEFYAMVRADDEAGRAFCEGDALTENADGSATCTLHREGAFDDLFHGDQSENSASFTSEGPGLVRVSFLTEGLNEAVTEGEELDGERRATMEGFFEGHTVTLTISGNKIVASNMTISDDGRSAELVVPIVDLFSGEAHLPDEIFAVVRVN